jgi:hypothetical protein
MTDKSSRNGSEFKLLDESAIVYRALLRKQWIDEENNSVLLFAQCGATS